MTEHERTEARPHPVSGYKGLHGYATTSEWLTAWLHHLDVLPLDERKVIVLQTLRTHGPQVSFWPQLIPALDALMREGKVGVREHKMTYEEVPEHQIPREADRYVERSDTRLNLTFRKLLLEIMRSARECARRLHGILMRGDGR